MKLLKGQISIGKDNVIIFVDSNDIVRVDTSIGFMCQPFILEER